MITTEFLEELLRALLAEDLDKADELLDQLSMTQRRQLKEASLDLAVVIRQREIQERDS